MSVICSINFTNGTGIYSGGENVSCEITIEVKERFMTSGIQVTILGESKVNWTKSRILNRCNTYLGNDIYFCDRTYLARDQSGQLFELEEKIYNYNYSFILPQRLPSSFYGKYGKTEYFVQVTLVCSYMSNEVFRKDFTIINNLDLNSHLRVPELRQMKMTLPNGCFKSRTLCIRLSTPSTGYVPGQTLSLTCFVSNGTSKNIDIVVGLEQKVCFTSESPCTKAKSTSNSIIKKTFPNIESFSDRKFYETLLIPSIPPSTQDTCKCIEISYYLYVKVRAGLFLKNVFLIIPVTIGAISICEIPTETATEEITLLTTNSESQQEPTIFRSAAAIAIPEFMIVHS